MAVHEAAPATLLRYVVKSSDVISDMRVNISEEHTERVIWYKERFLSDEEIIEHIVHNPTTTICWTIHRPKRGWYIRIRAPSFPTGVFISLMPLARSSPHHVDGALSFACRTNVTAPVLMSSPSTAKSSIDTDITLAGSSSTAALHSYPPTPPIPGPALAVHPPSPTTVHAKLDALSPRLRSQITQFVLAPHSTPHIPQEQGASFITRALSAFRNHAPSHSSSFTLCPINLPDEPSSSTSPASSHLSHCLPASPVPLLTFHDRTPLLTVRSTNGLLEINRTEEQSLGVEPSFWIAMALTYLEFLEEKESYLAAVTD